MQFSEIYVLVTIKTAFQIRKLIWTIFIFIWQTTTYSFIHFKSNSMAIMMAKVGTLIDAHRLWRLLWDTHTCNKSLNRLSISDIFWAQFAFRINFTRSLCLRKLVQQLRVPISKYYLFCVPTLLIVAYIKYLIFLLSFLYCPIVFYTTILQNYTNKISRSMYITILLYLFRTYNELPLINTVHFAPLRFIYYVNFSILYYISLVCTFCLNCIRYSSTDSMTQFMCCDAMRVCLCVHCRSFPVPTVT